MILTFALNSLGLFFFSFFHLFGFYFICAYVSRYAVPPENDYLKSDRSLLNTIGSKGKHARMFEIQNRSSE